MEIILKKDVENLGFADDVVTVKDGYGLQLLDPTRIRSIGNREREESIG